MNIIKTALVTLAMAGFATSATAQDSNFYGNLGVKTYEFDTYNILARVGYNFNQYIGAEVEGSIGIIDETIDGVDFETEWDIGGYLVGRYPVSDNFDVFARAGYSAVRIEISDDFDSLGTTLDGFAVGGGIQYNWDAQNGIRLGYTYNEGDGADADVVDLAYTRKF